MVKCRIAKHKKGRATAEDVASVRELGLIESPTPTPVETPDGGAEETTPPSSPDSGLLN